MVDHPHKQNSNSLTLINTVRSTTSPSAIASTQCQTQTYVWASHPSGTFVTPAMPLLTGLSAVINKPFIGRRKLFSSRIDNWSHWIHLQLILKWMFYTLGQVKRLINQHWKKPHFFAFAPSQPLIKWIVYCKQEWQAPHNNDLAPASIISKLIQFDEIDTATAVCQVDTVNHIKCFAIYPRLAPSRLTPS